MTSLSSGRMLIRRVVRSDSRPIIVVSSQWIMLIFYVDMVCDCRFVRLWLWLFPGFFLMFWCISFLRVGLIQLLSDVPSYGLQNYVTSCLSQHSAGEAQQLSKVGANVVNYYSIRYFTKEERSQCADLRQGEPCQDPKSWSGSAVLIRTADPDDF